MSDNYWQNGVVYFCGEYDSRTESTVNHLIVMFIETEIRAGYREGQIIKVYGQSYILTEREANKRQRMVTYHLQEKKELGRMFATAAYDDEHPPALSME